MAAGALWILDASINISMEPFRAFVADMLPDEQRARSFSTQSFFIYRHRQCRLCHLHRPDAQIPSHFNFKRAIPAWVRISLWIAAVQFCTWVGLLCLSHYFAVSVARAVFGATSPNDPTYSEGIVWAGYCSGFYSGVCALISPALPSLVKRVGKCKTHSFCLLAGAAGFLSIPLIHNKWMLLAPMVGVGIAWASILSMPYSILAAAIPQNKMGVYMGIFNFFIVLPEITASLLFGWIMSHLLNNNRMAALVVGGFCFIVAALLTLRIREPHVQESEEVARGSLAPV